MLFFIDESWQQTQDQHYKAGVLAAIPIASEKFNSASIQLHNIKKKHLGFQGANLEIKGHKILQRYYFRLEKKLEPKGVKSDQLNLARGILNLCDEIGVKVFASVVFAQDELDLECANENQLERPFFFLFERIHCYMQENFPDKIAKLVFDDRGITANERISKAVSNFFHRSTAGKSFERIMKAPLFAISTENVGIQIADVLGHIIGRRFTGDRRLITEFFQKVKELQFESKNSVGTSSLGTTVKLRGIKVIRDKKLYSDTAEEANEI